MGRPLNAAHARVQVNGWTEPTDGQTGHAWNFLCGPSPLIVGICLHEHTLCTRLRLSPAMIEFGECMLWYTPGACQGIMWHPARLGIKASGRSAWGLICCTLLRCCHTRFMRWCACQ